MSHAESMDTLETRDIGSQVSELECLSPKFGGNDVKDTMDRGSQCELISNMEKTGEDAVKSENVIRNIIGDILKDVVKESDATVGEYSLPTDMQNTDRRGVSKCWKE